MEERFRVLWNNNLVGRLTLKINGDGKFYIQ